LIPPRRSLGRAGAGVFIIVAALALLQVFTEQPNTKPVLAQRLPGDASLASNGPVDSSPTPPRQEWEIFPTRKAVIPLGRPTIQVPIEMYHYIRVNPDPRDGMGFNLSVTPADFRAQMDWLDANGYNPIDLEDLRGYMAGRTQLPAKPIVLTFDDGYADLYTEAFPVLKAHHFKAVAYIVTAFLGSPRYVDHEQVKVMERNGIQIASHTVRHVDLTRASPAQLSFELRDSKAALEALLGHPVLDFCYPAGANNPAVVQAVRDAGYESATTTAPGIRHSLGDRFTWTRTRVGGGMPLSRFVADLGPEEPSVVTLVDSPPIKAPRLEPILPKLFPLLAPAGAPAPARVTGEQR
jgi:peptidoglycan/xylan/chitin deacetylase (PgdA/CDA1 family)